jgi:hypothetical protein
MLSNSLMVTLIEGVAAMADLFQIYMALEGEKALLGCRISRCARSRC